MFHDEDVYPEPHAFKPERWLDSSGYLKGDIPISPFDAVFGYGRRLCPGLAFGRSNLWMNMATILSTCNIGMKIDKETGKPIVPRVEFEGDSVTRRVSQVVACIPAN